MKYIYITFVNINFTIMRERILKFLAEEQISSSKFADEIRVQRSSVSHILSGRNNPSFDFIQKILNKYNNVSADWLIMGKGEMFKEQPKQAQLFTEVSENEKYRNDKEKEVMVKSNSGKENDKSIELPKAEEKKEVNVEKIVIFYSDKSFKEYFPSK